MHIDDHTVSELSVDNFRKADYTKLLAEYVFK
jgi:hypothetical protein